MATDTHLQRIEQLVAAGKLTDDEAARLRQSMRTQAERDAPLRKAAAAGSKARRRLIPVLALLAIAFTLGALTVWLYSPSAPAGLETALSVPLDGPDRGDGDDDDDDDDHF